MTTAVVIALVGLIIVIAVHIAVIARWSGRIDGYMAANDKRIEAYIADNDRRVSTSEEEIKRLRDARHKSDGTLQRHEGILRSGRWLDLEPSE